MTTPDDDPYIPPVCAVCGRAADMLYLCAVSEYGKPKAERPTTDVWCCRSCYRKKRFREPAVRIDIMEVWSL